MNEITIRTSDKDWFKNLVQVYRKKQAITLIDDAGVGLEPSDHSLLVMGGKARLSGREWAGVLVSLGVGAAGLWLVRLAVVDPEPTSKLGLLLGGGVLCIVTGGGYASYILTHRKPPNVRASTKGLEIWWE